MEELPLYILQEGRWVLKSCIRDCYNVVLCQRLAFIAGSFTVVVYILGSVTLGRVRKNAVNAEQPFCCGKYLLLWAILFWSSSQQLEWTCLDFSCMFFLSPKTRNTLCPELLGYCPCKNVNEYGLKKVILTFLIISVSGYHLDLKSIF